LLLLAYFFTTCLKKYKKQKIQETKKRIALYPKMRFSCLPVLPQIGFGRFETRPYIVPEHVLEIKNFFQIFLPLF